jgi:hypothetical protein
VSEDLITFCGYLVAVTMLCSIGLAVYVAVTTLHHERKEAMKRSEVDPVCLIHGKKMSEHECLYCCLCYKPLTISECNILPNGNREDVCVPCAQEEQLRLKGYKTQIKKGGTTNA